MSSVRENLMYVHPADAWSCSRLVFKSKWLHPWKLFPKLLIYPHSFKNPNIKLKIEKENPAMGDCSMHIRFREWRKWKPSNGRLFQCRFNIDDNPTLRRAHPHPYGIFKVVQIVHVYKDGRFGIKVLPLTMLATCTCACTSLPTRSTVRISCLAIHVEIMHKNLQW